MKSLDRDNLERHSILIEYAGILCLLGEYLGKQELFAKQTPQICKSSGRWLSSRARNRSGAKWRKVIVSDQRNNKRDNNK